MGKTNSKNRNERASILNAIALSKFVAITLRVMKPRDEPTAPKQPASIGTQLGLEKPSQQSARHAKRDGYDRPFSSIPYRTALGRERRGHVTRATASIAKPVPVPESELQPKVLLEELDDIAEQNVTQRSLAAIDLRSHIGTNA